MVKVRTGWSERRTIVAATAVESMPPESHAPSGTSAIMRMRTASSSLAASASIASSSEPRNGSARPRSTTSFADQ